MDQHTGGKWLIHGTKRRKDNQYDYLILNYTPLYAIVQGEVMKRWYALYVFLCSYEFVIWPDCFVEHSCPGGFCPESGTLTRTYSITTLLGTDDWHLANRFSLVYVFVVVYLRRLYHSVSSRSRPCTSVNAPPHRKECPHMHATTPPHHHYHYHADLLTCIEHIRWTILEACVNTCWVYSVKSVSKM